MPPDPPSLTRFMDANTFDIYVTLLLEILATDL